MACLGVLFSLDDKTANRLLSFTNDAERLEYLQEEIEETYFEKHPERVAELDKAWDAIHRSLTDGKLEYINGNFPLNHVILGGKMIYSQGDYIMTLKDREQVKQIALGIDRADETFFKNGYMKIDPKNYGFPLTDDDFEYTWTWFEGSKEFWNLAAHQDQYVLFTADQ